MIEELVKEKRLERDYEETNKIMNAIHKQAYWRNQDEENKRMLANMDKVLQNKKNPKNRLLEDTLNFGMFVIVAIPTILLLVVLCY